MVIQFSVLGRVSKKFVENVLCITNACLTTTFDRITFAEPCTTNVVQPHANADHSYYGRNDVLGGVKGAAIPPKVRRSQEFDRFSHEFA